MSRDNADSGERWIDPVVLDENLICTWRSLIDWYQRLAERPFRVDAVSLQRDDAPPDYTAFRESMVNLLMHQDYADHSRKPEIRHYADRTVFWNPGDAFATTADLLEPGKREVRNSRIVTAFRRIGLSENAGWGLRDVFRNWQRLGYVPPDNRNDKSRKAFGLVLTREELLSERQILFQASLGVRLTNEQARVFALACREKEVTLSQIKAVTDLSCPNAVHLADSLVTNALFGVVEAGKRYALANHLEDLFLQTGRSASQPEAWEENLPTAQVLSEQSNLSTAQVPPLTDLSQVHWKIIETCDVPYRQSELLSSLELSSRGHFKERHLDPLIQSGIIAMTNPDKSRASNQQYVITEAGAQLKARRMLRDNDRNEEEND